MSTDKRKLLLARLDEIGAALARSGKALALIGLGSAGSEPERLDAYSDLDFFAIVASGCKGEFIDDLAWLSRIRPVVFSYRNTRDGHKVLFEDGVFCEFAVFEMPELRHIPFSPGRIVWKQADVEEAQLQPAPRQVEERSSAWLLGEALSNLYVGLSRHARGEKLAAMRAIQVQALDRVLELAASIEPAASAARDIFAFERRYEQRYPAGAQALAQYAQGYERNIESAQAILAFLDRHFELNPAMREAIAGLCGRTASEGRSR
ncbi:MAG: hypothetical protein HZB95_12590 [Nitrosomonadales bacterium]|nr:hypothetical protein [Nitrosomonadales bacterium]